MILRKLGIGVALATAVMLAVAGVSPAGAVTQPSFDTLRIDGNGSAVPYSVWVAWSPFVVPTPDGGAWAFFSAEVVNPDGTIGTKKLYVTRFNPASANWTPAVAMPGGEIQFGATAVVDTQGIVHLVYTDRANGDEGTFGQLVYRTTTADGGWTEGVAVAPSPDAGHQLSPELSLDRNGGLHLVWQDQRAVTAEARAAEASNADIFSSNLGADGKWSEPAQISARTEGGPNSSRPQLGTDGDRMIVVWSVYDPASLETAIRLEWSSKPIDGSAGWSAPQTVLERGDAQIGGRLLDLASDPSGGVALVFGRRANNSNTLLAQRLDPGSTTWSGEFFLAQGDRGSFPSAVYAADGSLVVVYNIGSGQVVQVGAVALVPGAPRGTVETALTAGDDGAQGRGMVDVDANGRIWVIYMHEPTGGVANQIRVLRGAQISAELGPEPTEATPVAAATPAP